MTVNSKAPMRRFGGPGLANQAANRLVQQPRQLSGYGKSIKQSSWIHAVPRRLFSSMSGLQATAW